MCYCSARCWLWHNYKRDNEIDEEGKEEAVDENYDDDQVSDEHIYGGALYYADSQDNACNNARGPV